MSMSDVSTKQSDQSRRVIRRGKLYVINVVTREAIREHEVNILSDETIEFIKRTAIWAFSNGCYIELINCLDDTEE